MDYSGKIITKNAVTPTQTAASGVWTLDDALQAQKGNNWPIPGVPNPISKSLRFNSADSAYLNRTPASAGNRKTWTWSAWVKRSAIGTGTYEIFRGDASTGGTDRFTGIRFIDDVLYIQDANTASYNTWWATSAVYRDPSAWYHIVVKYDTTQASSSNAVTLWVNGTQQTITFTAISGAYVQNRDSYINATNAQYVGIGLTSSGSLSSNYYSGYITDINFIDGQALTPSSFGENDTNTGVWIPKKYTGTYGTNGFYVNFKDATNTTTLGYDYSGNGNNWNANNFSVTAGAGNDSLTDVPTPWVGYSLNGDTGGVVRGNYPTWNPLKYFTSNYNVVLSNGNLDTSVRQTAATEVGIATMFLPNSGKWYWEVTLQTFTNASADISLGVCTSADATQNSASTLAANGGRYRGDGSIRNLSGVTQTSGGTWNQGDIIGIAVDVTSGTVQFYKNGVAQGATPSFSFTAGTELCPYIANDNTANAKVTNANFGQRPFAYTPPAGFKSLCTTNLPTPTIGATSTTLADDYFNTVLYTGNGTTQSVTGVGFQPDLVWAKDRSHVANHRLFDAVRGASKILYSSLTNAETTEVTGLTSFDSNGFSIGAGEINDNAHTYVAWNWKANGAGSSNTAGTVTSTVSANTTAGFSIATYTGNSSNLTFGHGLGVAPAMYVIKWRNNTSQWYLYHKSLGADKYLQLNLTAGAVTDTAIWQNTSPTSSLIYVGSGIVGTNTAVCYAFAEVAGYSAFGSYTGNGSTDGPFVYLGFRPKYILIKESSAADNSWTVLDAVRNPYNVVNYSLFPNLSQAENTSAIPIDFVANGIKIRSTFASVNNNAQTFIYAAFAESPFKFANAR